MKKIKWGVIGTAGIARSCTIPGMIQAYKLRIICNCRKKHRQS